MSGRPSPAERDILRAIEPAFALHRASGNGAFLLLCEHASHHIPARFDHLGLAPAEVTRHIGWDPGACALAMQLADALDSPLVYATQSRLLLDLNRHPSAPDSIPIESDGTRIPGNAGLTPEQRLARQRWLYEPFHAAVENLLRSRMARGQVAAVVSIHSFTPVMAGQRRPWHVGVLSDRDRRLAEVLIAEIGASGDWCIGDNQPYAPADGVYHSLGRHGQAQGLASAMIEVRNDLLADAAGVQRWGERLAGALARSLERLESVRSGSGASGVGRASGGAR
jgi:predicted N-formylglutamate amidohydrolase